MNKEQHHHRHRVKGTTTNDSNKRFSYPESSTNNYLFSKRLRQSSANGDSLCGLLDFDDDELGSDICAPAPSQARSTNNIREGGGQRHRRNNRNASNRHLHSLNLNSAEYNSESEDRKGLIIDFRNAENSADLHLKRSNNITKNGENNAEKFVTLGKMNENPTLISANDAKSTSNDKIDDIMDIEGNVKSVAGISEENTSSSYAMAEQCRSAATSMVPARCMSNAVIANSSSTDSTGKDAFYLNVIGSASADKGGTMNCGRGGSETTSTSHNNRLIHPENGYRGDCSGGEVSRSSTRKSPRPIMVPSRSSGADMEYRGHYRLCLNGWIVVPKQCSIFLLTVFLLVLTMSLFCIFDLPYLTRNVSITFPFIAGALFLLVMSSLFKTSFSDPGILPRASIREVVNWDKQLKNDNCVDRNQQPRTKIVRIMGENIKLKYCFTCCLFRWGVFHHRPPRSSHCSICDNCILNFDHHCPWVGNCVGQRNYRYFYFFIFILSILDCFIGASIITHLVLLTKEKGVFLEAIKDSPSSMFVGVINLISVWSILGLFGFHTYLLSISQTTNEDIKGTFSKNRIRNPYNSQNFFRNIFSVLCGPEPPSLIPRNKKMEPIGTVSVDAEMFRRFTVPNTNAIKPVRAANTRIV